MNINATGVEMLGLQVKIYSIAECLKQASLALY